MSHNDQFVLQRTYDVKDCNIQGLKEVEGKWVTKNLLGFIKKYATLKASQKTFAIRTIEFPKFCSFFDLDFRFKQHTIVTNERMGSEFTINHDGNY